jgi:hypothetical protein
MPSPDEIWKSIGTIGEGGATRVDASHPSDLYGLVDLDGRPGILLVSEGEPPGVAPLEAVEVTKKLRADGRWALSIVLQDPGLRDLFSGLCNDLVESSREVLAENAPAFVVSRLVGWRELLERGTGPIGINKLRGIVAELWVLRECLKTWSAHDVVAGWIGPLGSPQDFALPGLRIEVKATFPSSRSVRVNSVEQLESDLPMKLVVVSLATIAGSPEGLAPAVVIDHLETVLAPHGPELVHSFRDRLRTTGYVDMPALHDPMFRLDGVLYFDVSEEFPRIPSTAIGKGISSVSYDLQLAALAPFRIPEMTP